MLVTTLFAKKIINLIDAKYAMLSFIPDTFKVNWFEMVHFEHEKKENECTLGSDGFWMSNKKDCRDGKSRENTHRSKFFWRIEPNYCVEGQPCFSNEKIDEIYKKSETKKTIFKLNEFDFCLEWFGFELPTKIRWGLKMKPVHITVYRNGEIIYIDSLENRSWKKAFIKFVETYEKP